MLLQLISISKLISIDSIDNILLIGFLFVVPTKDRTYKRGYLRLFCFSNILLFNTIIIFNFIHNISLLFLQLVKRLIINL